MSDVWTTYAPRYRNKQYIPSAYKHLYTHGGRSGTSDTQKFTELRLLYERKGTIREPFQCSLRDSSDVHAQMRAQSDEGGVGRRGRRRVAGRLHRRHGPVRVPARDST